MDVLLDSVKNVSVTALFAYPLTRFSALRRAMSMMPAVSDSLFLGLVFGGLSICGNLTTTVVFNQAILPSGLVGSVVGGVIAGPKVGLLAGLIGGLHRYAMGGFTAVPDGMTIVLSGLLGSIFYWRFKENRMLFMYSFFAGLLASALGNVLILLLAQPPILAVTFVKWTGLINSLVNGVGTGIFTSVVRSEQSRQHSIGTSYAKKATEIAQETLPVIKERMDESVARDLVGIIHSALKAGAVAITNGETILAMKGEGSRIHLAENRDLALAKDFTGFHDEYRVANSKEEIGCKVPGCPHDAAIIAPVYCGNERLGFLQVFKIGEAVYPPDIELVTGVAKMLSSQFNNAKLARAEYAALRSQINPHFLFNTLSAIKLQIREDPSQAQNLLLALASFFRRTLETSEDIIPLSEELKCVEFYVTIQQARFGDRLKVVYEISPECMAVPVPAFTVQPLVENCFNHGFVDKINPLVIKITASNEQGIFVLRVEDDGVGFPEEVVKAVREDRLTRKMGVGLTNVNRRLKGIYGRHFSLALGNRVPGAFVEIQIQPEGRP